MRRRTILGVAIALGATALMLSLIRANGAARHEPPRPPVEGLAELLPGSRYRVELRPHTNGRTVSSAGYEGTILRAAADGIELAITAKVYRHSQTPLLAAWIPALPRAPYVGQYFRPNSGVGQTVLDEPEELWIAQDEIDSIDPVRSPGFRTPSHKSGTSNGRH